MDSDSAVLSNANRESNLSKFSNRSEQLADDSNHTNSCIYVEKDQFITEKFYMIAICGSIVAIVAVINNVVLALSLFANRQFRHNHTLYLALLAVLDVLLCACYVAIFSVEILWDYYNNYWLYIVWHWYVRPVFALARIVGTASTYLIVAALFERFLCIWNLRWWKYRMCTPRDRVCIIAAVLLFSIATRLTIFWELEIVINPDCLPNKWGYVNLKLSQFARNNHFFRTYYKLWFENIVQIFGPFIILLILNMAIVIRLRSTLRIRTAILQMALSSKTAMQRKVSLKSATKSLIAIVTTYLICNAMAFLLSVIEHVDEAFLRRHFIFYTFASDVTTLLHVLSSGIRIYIYSKCDPVIRKVLLKWLKRNRALLKQSIRSKRLTTTARHIATIAELIDETSSDIGALSTFSTGAPRKNAIVVANDNKNAEKETLKLIIHNHKMSGKYSTPRSESH